MAEIESNYDNLHKYSIIDVIKKKIKINFFLNIETKLYEYCYEISQIEENFQLRCLDKLADSHLDINLLICFVESFRFA